VNISKEDSGLLQKIRVQRVQLCFILTIRTGIPPFRLERKTTDELVEMYNQSNEDR